MKCSIVLFSIFITIGEGSRILVSAPFGPKSHQNMFVPLIKELSNKGHNITVLSNYESSELLNISNIRFITVHELAIDLKRLPNIFETILDPDYWELTKSAYNTFFYEMAESITMTFDHPGIRQLLSNPDEKFDLVLMSHAASLASLPMVWHFKAPMISMSPNILFPGTSTALGDDEHDSYAPFMLSSFTDRMTLSERTMNFMITRAFIYFASRWHFATSRSYAKRTGLIPDCPPLEEIERNMSLVFINSHPAFSYPRALPPQVIEIGAMHCRPAKPLLSVSYIICTRLLALDILIKKYCFSVISTGFGNICKSVGRSGIYCVWSRDLAPTRRFARGNYPVVYQDFCPSPTSRDLAVEREATCGSPQKRFSLILVPPTRSFRCPSILFA